MQTTTERKVMSIEFLNDLALECLWSGIIHDMEWTYDMVVGYSTMYCLNADDFTDDMWVTAQIKFQVLLKRAREPELEVEYLKLSEEFMSSFEEDDYADRFEEEDNYEEEDSHQLEWDAGLTDMEVRKLEADMEDSYYAKLARLDEGQEY
jgi:hypothetical protein